MLAPYYPQHLSHSSGHASHPHHAGRSRRAARAANNHHHNHQKQLAREFQANREMLAKREAYIEAMAQDSFRREFEAARSFELEDDETFCPFHLLTEDDLQSIPSSGSDRSSLSSGSPEQSPLQHQIQPSTFLLPPTSAPFTPAYQQQATQPKIHQPLAQRTRNAIPIVDPTTRAVASPPPSVSPAKQMQSSSVRRW